jgi:calpain-15
VIPKFSKGNGPELWVIIMEKVCAKIHGSYDRIVSGSVYTTLRDLTGAPGFYINQIQKETGLFEKLLDWDKKGYMMSTSIHSKNDADMKKWGLITGHAYSLIQAAQVEKND